MQKTMQIPDTCISYLLIGREKSSNSYEIVWSFFGSMNEPKHGYVTGYKYKRFMCILMCHLVDCNDFCFVCFVSTILEIVH